VLVLSRKPEQSLHLGDDITVTVLGIEGDRVKLGIDAPRSVAVLRHEVFQQIQEANVGAVVATETSALQTVVSALRHR
jgi:carbon storage regulator